jgi:hypothetical protein
MTIGGGGHHHDAMIRHRPYLRVVFGDRPHGILRCEDGGRERDSSFLGFVGGGRCTNFGKNESWPHREEWTFFYFWGWRGLTRQIS